MNTNPTVLISNPNAGRGGARRALEIKRFCEALKARGVKVEALSTNAPGDAARLAATAAKNGAATIIVSGGDGTINEALQGMVGTKARLAIWPRGTANVLAREIGMPTRLEKVAAVIARGETKRIYPGCAVLEETHERRYFFLMAGIGLDASIVKSVRPKLKRRFGKAAFWYSGLGHLARWQPVHFQIEVEGQAFSATFAAVGKGSRYGGDLSITPRARLDVPEFEICIINSQSRLRYLSLLPGAIRNGVANGTKGVRFLMATQARVTGNVAVQVDGELIGKPPMTFEIVKEPIEIIVPENQP
ncbi:MAG: diacylglycerol kinase family lipid kinase [Pyrinomonadaceae bacterium]|nr:diacylglycerol kinase family lipid kinase [Pyrinomonadaceae bacterium]